MSLQLNQIAARANVNDVWVELVNNRRHRIKGLTLKDGKVVGMLDDEAIENELKWDVAIKSWRRTSESDFRRVLDSPVANRSATPPPASSDIGSLNSKLNDMCGGDLSPAELQRARRQLWQSVAASENLPPDATDNIETSLAERWRATADGRRERMERLMADVFTPSWKTTASAKGPPSGPPSFTRRDGVAFAAFAVSAVGVVAVSLEMIAAGFGHILCTTCGFCGMVSAEYFAKRDRSSKWDLWACAHLAANVAGLRATLYGFNFVYAMKEKYKMPHAGSLHGKIGYSVMAALCLQTGLSIGTFLLSKITHKFRLPKFRLPKHVGKLILVALGAAHATGWAQIKILTGEKLYRKAVGTLAAATVAGVVL